MEKLPLVTKPNSLPAKLENSNVKRALADRLFLSEALEAVSDMLRGYPNRSQADKSYIGAIGELLMQYPRQVAMRCADPFTGVARETHFLPTVSDIVAWCERDAVPLHEESAHENRVAEQLRLRDEWRPTPPAVHGFSYAEFVKRCETNGQKPGPVGAFERGGYLGGSDAD